MFSILHGFPSQFQLSIGLWVSGLRWSASFYWNSPHCPTKIPIPLIPVQKLWSFMGLCKGAKKAATESCWVRKLWQQFSNQNVSYSHARIAMWNLMSCHYSVLFFSLFSGYLNLSLWPSSLDQAFPIKCFVLFTINET